MVSWFERAKKDYHLGVFIENQRARREKEKEMEMSPLEKELALIASLYKQLEQLETVARYRVWNYLAEHLKVTP